MFHNTHRRVRAAAKPTELPEPDKLRRTNDLRERDGQHDGGQGGDFRPGRVRPAFYGRRRGDRARERHRVRPRRRVLHELGEADSGEALGLFF